jgi:serine/threonine-protein kinase HipA
MTAAGVWIWGRRAGAVTAADPGAVAAFEYDPEFVADGLDLAPLQMPLRAGVFRFPQLSQESFHGLPGLLSDSLPDRWGSALIDAWLARRGQTAADFDVVQRLCYIGTRGMGALEFQPATGPGAGTSEQLDVKALVDLAADALRDRTAWKERLGNEREEAMRQILKVGTSAGGARAKALIALHPTTMEVRSGQGDVEPGFEHWILKFDGVSDEAGEFSAATGYGLVEYAYSQMARAAGIQMTETQLLPEGDRRHFMTRRFDRSDSGEKLHMQSLAAIAHLDFNLPGANGYEHVFRVIRRLRLSREAIEQQFRRMLFNVVARNQDDHVKNIAFVMGPDGGWSLSPAFDLTYAHGRGNTAQHQMSINGRRDGFELADFEAVAELASMKRGQAKSLLADVTEAVRRWPEFAEAAGIDGTRSKRIGEQHRLDLI